MSERNYRRVLGIVVAICILLAVALGYVLFRDHRTAATDDNDPVIARGPAKGPDATAQPMTMKDRRVRRLCAQSHTGTAVAAAPTSNRRENGSSRDAGAQ